jgi:HEAT repeat protein
MLILCPSCWNELKSTPTTCPKCGTHVDFYSREYEHRLVSMLAHSDAELRAQICWALGSRRKRSSVPVLIELLRDPDVVVQVAALRGLGEIGDRSAASAVEKLTTSDDTVVKAVADKVLRMLSPTTPPSQLRVV